MSIKTSRTTITIETHNVTIVRINGKHSSRWCERCQTSVAAFSPEQAVLSFLINPAEIENHCQSERLHAVGQTALLLCGNSLAEFLNKGDIQC
jgi:hypothetical protein